MLIIIYHPVLVKETYMKNPVSSQANGQHRLNVVPESTSIRDAGIVRKVVGRWPPCTTPIVDIMNNQQGSQGFPCSFPSSIQLILELKKGII